MAKSPDKMTAKELEVAKAAKLAALRAKAPAKRAEQPVAKPTMLQNYKTLGSKMVTSAKRATGRGGK